MKKISLIILTHNRSPHLVSCLGAISNQTYLPCETIIINSGNKLEYNFNNFFQNKINIKIIDSNAKTLGSARNEGIKYTHGDLICFIDDDVIIPQDWIEKIANLYTKLPNAAAIGSNILITTQKRFYRESMQILSDNLIKKSILAKEKETNLLKVNFLSTMSIIVKKECLQNIGGFDPVLDTYEDMDFCFQLKNNNYAMYLAKDIYCQHYDRDNLKDFVKKFYEYGKGYAVLNYKWKRKIRYYLLTPIGIFIFYVSTIIWPVYEVLISGDIFKNIKFLPLFFLKEIAFKTGASVQLCKFVTNSLTKTS